MTEPELLPCPFCGSTDVRVSTDDTGWPRWVDCGWCDAMGPTAEIESSNEQALAYVVAGWNRRASAPMAETKSVLDQLSQDSQDMGLYDPPFFNPMVKASDEVASDVQTETKGEA